MEIIAQVKITGAKKVNSLSDISDNSRLFYELGHYRVLRKYLDKDGDVVEEKEWVRTEIFKEIENVKSFLETDKRMSDREYIEHHNFVVVD